MKYLDFYRKHIPTLPSPNEKGEVLVLCVFHNNQNTPSLGINLETGKWKCFVPSCPGSKGGGYRKFASILNGEVQGVAMQVSAIDPALVLAHHNILLAGGRALDLLTKQRGYTLETIKRFELGYDSDRIWIPVRDERGDVVNVRKYKPTAWFTPDDYKQKRDWKTIGYGSGYNVPRLWPIESLRAEVVDLFEGETDTITACQLGLNAATVTGGSGTWSDKFSKQLAGKDVYICYDADEAGRQGADVVAMQLLGHARRVFKVRLPLRGTKDENDFSDYVKLGHTRADYEELRETAELVEPVVSNDGPAAEVLPLHLSEIGQDQFVGKRVQSTVLVAGKDLAPFQVPFKIAFSCDQLNSEKMCKRCDICSAGGQREVALEEWRNELLQMVNVPIEKLNAIVSRIGGVPDRCPKFKHEVKEYANVESVKAIPEIDFTSERSEYVIRNLYYLGHGLEPNHTYKLSAVVMPDPKTQYATALIYEAEPAQDSIEKFELNDEVLADLQMFKVKE